MEELPWHHHGVLQILLEPREGRAAIVRDLRAADVVALSHVR